MERVLVLGSLRIPFLSGIQVDRFEGFVQGMGQLKASEYTAVIMDLRSNGNNHPLDKVLESIEVIQERSHGVPIIIVARENSLEMERSIRQKGIFYYLCGDLDPKIWKEIFIRSLVYSTSRRPRETTLSLAS